MAGIPGGLKQAVADRRDFWSRKAGADIGIFSTPDYPLTPIIAVGVPVYISETASVSINIEVKQITVTDTTAVVKYDGLSYNGAYLGDVITIYGAGEAWIPVGTAVVAAGDLVIWEIDSTENSSGATIGDCMPWDQASGASSGDGYSNNSVGSLADIHARFSATIGRATTNGAARTSPTVFEYVLVRLKGW